MRTLQGQEVRAVSRTSALFGDLTKPDTLHEAFDGADAVFLVVLPGEPVADVLDVAKRSGVRRVVLLSSGAVGNGADPVARLHADAEQAVQGSGLAWTILRPRWFTSNALWWAPAIRAAGVVRSAYPDAVTAPTHEQDIADAAAHALTSDELDGGKHVLTGPQVLRQTEQVAIIGNARVERISPEQARIELLRHLPADIADTMLAQQANLTPADIELSTVERITGRAARTFADWAEENRSAFGNEQ